MSSIMVGSTARYREDFLKPRTPMPDDCPRCHGKGVRANEEVNKHRHHFMQYITCECKGSSGKGALSPHQGRGLPWVDQIGFLSDSPDRSAPSTVNSEAFKEGYDTIFTKGG